jgi:hypothetical protein
MRFFNSFLAAFKLVFLLAAFVFLLQEDGRFCIDLDEKDVKREEGWKTEEGKIFLFIVRALMELVQGFFSFRIVSAWESGNRKKTLDTGRVLKRKVE